MPGQRRGMQSWRPTGWRDWFAPAASDSPQLKRFPVGKSFPRINQGEHQRSGLTTEATKATENHQQAFSKGNLPHSLRVLRALRG